MEPTQAFLQIDPFGGMADFTLSARSRAVALTFDWPPDARRSVEQLQRAQQDWQALAEEALATAAEVQLLTDFENFKKVTKPVLQDHIVKVKAKVDKLLAFQIVLVQP